VSDTGMGIRAEDRDFLFEAFSQLDVRKNSGIEGTGLGLPISRGYARAMGGDITVESVYGAGSTFTLCLPQAVCSATPIVQVEKDSQDKVLLLGHGIVCDSVEKMLGQLQVAHTRAASFAEATRSVWEHRPTHIVYVDTTGEDVIDIPEEQRVDIAGIQLVAVTAYGKVNDQRWSRDVRILYEPVTINVLAQTLDYHVYEEKADNAELDALEEFKAPSAVVLLVDDNEINLLVAEEVLSSYALQVITAQSGPEAIAKVQQCDVDLVLMDDMMPGMDGVEATGHIRALGGKYARLPIIALTANAISGSEAYYLANQMSDYLSKPMDFSSVSRKLMRWLPPEKVVISGG